MQYSGSSRVNSSRATVKNHDQELACPQLFLSGKNYGVVIALAFACLAKVLRHELNQTIAANQMDYRKLGIPALLRYGATKMKMCAAKQLGKMAALGAALAFSTLSIADPIVYDFDLTYDGTDITVDDGSTDPIGVSMNVDDSFFLDLHTLEGDFWLVEEAASFFPFFAFATDESAERFVDFELTLLLDGAEQFSLTGENERQAQVHIGTNSVTLAANLAFDQILLNLTLLETFAIGGEDDPDCDPEIDDCPDFAPIGVQEVGTTFRNFPIGGKVPGGFTAGITYNSAPAGVPEPGMMGLLGLGLVGLGLRRRKK